MGALYHQPLAPLMPLRHRLAMAIENAIAALDALGGDPDLEDQGEDEGGQCEDEGFPEYA